MSNFTMKEAISWIEEEEGSKEEKIKLNFRILLKN